MKEFIRAALIRAIRTVAQTAVATIGTAAVIESVDWRMVISASILAGILSILTSVATGLPEVEKKVDKPAIDKLPIDSGE
jgi:ABC-type proline/glycine betaine transport system permease subunit